MTFAEISIFIHLIRLHSHLNRDNQKNVMLSSNSGGQYYERDVMILWVNQSTENDIRWQIDAMHFALTHAKHAIYIIGSTKILRVRRYFFPSLSLSRCALFRFVTFIFTQFLHSFPLFLFLMHRKTKIGNIC